MASTTGAAEQVVTEDALLATPNRELDALFRRSPAGPIPIGVLDGVAVLFPGSRVSRVVAGLARARVAGQSRRAGRDMVPQPHHAAAHPGGCGPGATLGEP